MGHQYQLQYGDLNVALPRRGNNPKNWFKSKGFNMFRAHSNIMFDFIFCYVNNLTLTDFAESQCVKYTYFSHWNNQYTWIDHILTTDHNFSRIKSCQIIPEESGNVSDHLPIRMDFSVITTVKAESIRGKQTKRHGASYWGNVQCENEYYDILQREFGKH